MSEHRHRWKYDRLQFRRECRCGKVELRRLTEAEDQQAEAIVAELERKAANARGEVNEPIG